MRSTTSPEPTGLPVRARTAVALAVAAVGLTGIAAWSAPTVTGVRLVAQSQSTEGDAGRLDERHVCPDYKGPGTENCLPSNTGIDGKPDGGIKTQRHVCPDYKGPGTAQCLPSNTGIDGKIDRGNHRPGSRDGHGRGGHGQGGHNQGGN